MDVVDTVNVASKRKWVVIPVLLLTLGLIIFMAVNVTPHYQARGSILIEDSLGEASAVTPALFAESLQDQEVRAVLAKEGVSGDYTVESTDNLVRVRGLGRTPKEAVGAATAVLDSMPERMVSEENAVEVPDELRNEVEILNVPTRAILDGDSGFMATGVAQVVSANEGGSPIGAGVVRDVLVEVLPSDEVVKSVVDDGGLADYELGYDTRSPVVAIEASGTDQAATVRTIELVIAEAEEQSIKLAKDAGLTITQPPLRPVVVPSAAVEEGSGLLRSVIAIGIVGLGLAIGLAIAIEAYTDWRSGSPGKKPEPDDAERDSGDSPRGGTGPDPEPVDSETDDTDTEPVDTGSTGDAET